LTRQGLEEYVSDCVILLDHRVHGQISTRRMRVVKYRGSTHGTNEYPFLIDKQGISVLPITGAGMNYGVSAERVSTGIRELDDMLGGRGFYRGSSVLLSGTAGTGKSSVAAHLANETCRRGERCLFFSFEESPAQIMRNMRSLGIHLEEHVKKGLLMFHSSRPTVHGLEMHLVLMHKLIENFKPAAVIVDPVSNLQSGGTLDESTNMLIRLVDFLRLKKITALMVSLTSGRSVLEATDEGLSSMVDSWLLLRYIETNGERNRLIYILKARGIAHSNQVREFLITSKGIKLVEAYLGSEGVLTGSAKLNQQSRERAEETAARQELEQKKLSLVHRRKAVEAKIENLRLDFLAEEEEFDRIAAAFESKMKQGVAYRMKMAASRRVTQAAKHE